MRLILPPSSSSGDSVPRTAATAMADPKSASTWTILEDDTDPLEKFQLKNEMELYVVFQISEDEWEPITPVDNGTAGGLGG
jgi:hypothetical protein